MGLIENSKDLRKNMTRHERHLWYDFLKNHPLKWRRQHIINNYIVDFYSKYAMLAIEIDGSQHYEEQIVNKDNVRTMIIEKYGIMVIRFSNYDIDKQFRAVCETIDYIANERIKTLKKVHPTEW